MCSMLPTTMKSRSVLPSNPTALPEEKEKNKQPNQYTTPVYWQRIRENCMSPRSAEQTVGLLTA